MESEYILNMYFSNIEERIRNCSSYEDAKSLIDNRYQSFQEVCMSDMIKRSVWDILQAMLVSHFDNKESTIQ
jgi:hypothetical protein